jgi:hypothetical protein
MALMLHEDPVAHAGFIGLLVECPLNRGNPAGCQLFEKRQLPLTQRYAWSKSLTMEEAFVALDRCAECMARQVKLNEARASTDHPVSG